MASSYQILENYDSLPTILAIKGFFFFFFFFFLNKVEIKRKQEGEYLN